jgi:hypothetical protein
MNIFQYLEGDFFNGFFAGCFFCMAAIAFIHLTFAKHQGDE